MHLSHILPLYFAVRSLLVREHFPCVSISADDI